jgi:2-dehydro-3-deoxyphosphogluconate aldolase/(4S)-4-hydroxy-2-oxoglutarate aldolase
MPTGGVSTEESNLKAWFDAGVTCVGMGSQLISKEILAKKDFTGVEKSVRQTLETISKLRK